MPSKCLRKTFSLITRHTCSVVPLLDPHEANLLVRAHPKKKGYPQIVLLDHGLYKGKWRKGSIDINAHLELIIVRCTVWLVWRLLYDSGMIRKFHNDASEEIRAKQACTLILKMRCDAMRWDECDVMWWNEMRILELYLLKHHRQLLRPYHKRIISQPLSPSFVRHLTELGDDFRKASSRLWRGLIMADEKIIKYTQHPRLIEWKDPFIYTKSELDDLLDFTWLALL